MISNIKVLDFLPPHDRARYRHQYVNGDVIECDSSAELKYQLSLIQSNDSPVIIQILAHGYATGWGLSNTIGESLSWQDMVQALMNARTNYYVRLNLLQPCFSDSVRLHLTGFQIDSVWVNTSGINDQFSAAFIANEFDSFDEFIVEEVFGLIEIEYEELNRS